MQPATTDVPASRARTRRTFAVVGLVALVFYAYVWFLEDWRPNIRWIARSIGPVTTAPSPPVPNQAAKIKHFGWYAAWPDQSYYHGEARDLARFDLPGANLDPKDMAIGDTRRHRYLYGLGYPLLAVPVIWAGLKGDPYLVVNAALYVGAVLLTFAVGRRVLRPPWTALAVAAVMLSPLTRFFVQPWGTSVTVVGVLVALYVAMLDDERANRWRVALALGLTTAITFSARYIDVAFVLAITGLSMLPDPRRRWRLVVGVGSLLSVAVALTLWSQQVAYGKWTRTPYGEQARNQGLKSPWLLSRAPRQFVEVFLSGRTGTGTPGSPNFPPILRSIPWLVLVPVGAYVLRRWGRAGGGRAARTLFQALLVSVAGTIAYCSWYAGGGTNLPFWNVRFWICWFPVWAIGAAAAAQWLSQRWGDGSAAPADPPAGDTVTGDTVTGDAAPGDAVPSGAGFSGARPGR